MSDHPEFDRTIRPDFGTLGVIDETLAQAGLDEPLPSSPLLCASLDEVRRFAQAQIGGGYSPSSDRRTSLELIAVMAGILNRPVPDQTPPATAEVVSEDERQFYERTNRQDDFNARVSALDFALKSGADDRSITDLAGTYYAFLTAEAPPGKVYATKADVDGLHERIDQLTPPLS